MAGMMLLQSFKHLLKLVTVGYESAINSATKIYTDRYAAFYQRTANYRQMRKTIFLIFVLNALISCSLIDNQKKLNDSDLIYLKDLGLLGEEESVLCFSPSINIKSSGNFITNKRIASYWFDKDTSKSFKESAFYSDIIELDSLNLTNAWTVNSYLTVTKKDNTKFKVYIEKDKYYDFVKIAFENWEKIK
jgi:hypothetical protein